MEHECTRALKGAGGQSIAVECSCGWSDIVKGDNPHEALVLAVNRYADHAVVQAGTDGS